VTDKQIHVYDIETLKSCFTYTAYNIHTKEILQFVLHKDRFELDQLLNHLKQCKGQIGFNNINFDYPIIHFILNKSNKWIYKNIIDDLKISDIITQIYEEAQRIIEEQNKKEFNTIVAIKQSEVLIPQLDLFKIWHYNNKARSTSLKALEISMNYPNVMEMSVSHTKENITLEEIPEILLYNLNDVLATYEFYKKSLPKIDLRKSLQKEYGIPCLNWSDSKIGEQLVLKLYCDKTGLSIWDVKEMRSNRLKIALNDVILPYIKFESLEFNNLLDYFKFKVITETKGSIEESVIYNGMKYDYGTGGIHSCIKPGIYESDDNYIIIDCDVASLYPSLMILNMLYPEHLGKQFIDVYKQILDMRIAAKKDGNMLLSDAYKLALNSCYGKSNDKHSFLFDPKLTMAVTLAGQLSLSMLIEMLHRIPNIIILQSNTDGITCKVPNDKHSINMYYNICKEWESITKLTLEYAEYSKMVIRDVNNYLAVYK